MIEGKDNRVTGMMSNIVCSQTATGGSRPRPVAQLVEHRVVVREVVSSTPAGPHSGS